jgi:translation initiation factor 5A
MAEGDITHKGISSLKKGNYIIIDGVACTVFDTQTSRPGKHGHAKIRLTAVGMIDGKKREIVMPGHEHVECPIIGKKTAQVLSVSGNTANVMDIETYETFDLEVPEEFDGQIVDGVSVLYWEILSDRIIKQIKSSD